MLNKVLLVGNLGADPETRDLNGKTMATFNMATSEKYKDRDGQVQENTEWHRVVVWGPQAGPVGKFLKKGSTVIVEGKISTAKKDDKYYTNIVAQKVTFMSASKDGGSASQGGSRSKPQAEPQYDDDLPF